MENEEKTAKEADGLKKGVEGIVFGYLGEQRFFLLLHRVLNWRGWEFPKGGIDKGETPEKALKREILEETALKRIEIVGKLPEKKEWEAKGVKYSYDVFLAKADMNERARVSRTVVEHDTLKWCNKQQVMEMLRFDNSKETFRKAFEEIEKLEKK